MQPSDDRLIPHILPNGLTVLERRYLRRNQTGEICETPADLFCRVALHVAQGELAYGQDTASVERVAQQFYDMLAGLDFLPNSPTLLNAGRPLGQLSACFVLPIADSLASIFESLKHAALIHQSGGGTGFCFSQLRPAGDGVGDTREVAAGPIAFMEVYNAAVDSIKQGGQRKGANMGLLRVDHPDVEAFISAKDDLRRVTNFNISIGITHAFMDAVARNADFSLIHPTTGQVVKTVAAQGLMARIVDCAWRTGEPGLIFLDRVNVDNPTPSLGALAATNPCGEVPLLPYEACNLGSINLMNMLDERNQLDWEKLARTVRLAVHFLDNVITVNQYPLPETRHQVAGNRKIGLGVMGWADCLMAQGIAYNSDAAIQLAQGLACWMDYQAKLASVDLARQRGAFPNFVNSRYQDAAWLTARYEAQLGANHRVSALEWQAMAERIQAVGIRNATTTCIAPTGTISLIAGVSGGIEPVFALAYTRNVLNNTRLKEVHPLFARWLQQQPQNQEALLQQVAQAGSLSEIQGLPEAVKRIFVTSLDIAPSWHVRMQAAFQAFTDNGVSKTINVPQSATRGDVAAAFQLAYEMGIKGVTVYRNNSRQDQPLLLATAESPMVQTPPREDPPAVCETCD
ncbi:adenosylcobalamin-dependent ribonucleoside-diphosphate reductase [Vampirovibrio sp.]|uniref:adenosylcobalamin-dependent ribonucleoside-diphosphate reductase n=1 Tax=Vampirovibrio sp. TaxID=2717857 RepID=UPI0035946B46